MTLLFYSAAQIDEDKGMKERRERERQTEEATRRATRKSVDGRSHLALGDEIGNGRLSDDNGGL